jgi:hypothetical protein
MSDRRGAMMPRRRNTRAHNRARAITAQRKLNSTQHTPNDYSNDHGNDPPPF